MGEKNCADVCAEIVDFIPYIVKKINEEYHITEKDNKYLIYHGRQV